MTTSMTPNGTTGNKLGFWKILGIIAVVLLALAMVGPLLKGLFWIALIGLAIYGGFMLFRSKSANRPNGPTSV
ncbi:hypothetical protein [Gordonia insulae]|uniref:Uncharacterized protein n=1 Tax=Gordonia insulae TaxID=2420509 RepID=A0A3G8JWG5_9ACTN|nr:hypothetical protein [Gordonia insulae]AZG48530.1 hypothetical protein D7316_05147 [Gordonia insulae]